MKLSTELINLQIESLNGEAKLLKARFEEYLEDDKTPGYDYYLLKQEFKALNEKIDNFFKTLPWDHKMIIHIVRIFKRIKNGICGI